jgi:RNA polymerase sigma-70 factor (ECF subfamily)
MEANDAATVVQILAGDRDAFGVLVERHSRNVFRLAYRMTGNKHDAEDVVQETFLRAYRHLGQFGARSNFGTWLYRVTVNCALDLLRKRERQDKGLIPGGEPEAEGADPLAGVAAPGPTPERLLLGKEVQRQMESALAGLSGRERAAFVLRHFEGKSIEEIGRILGLRTSATKNTVFRAVKKLRQTLQPVASVLV